MRKITAYILAALLCITALVVQAEEVKYVSKITVFESPIYIDRYEEAQIEYKVTPSDATNTEVLFKSMNDSIVEVDDEGVVYAKRGGSARIKLTSADEKAKAYVTVHVNYDKEEDYDRDDEIRTLAITKDGKVVNEAISVMETESITLKARIYPDTANQTVRWKSDNEKIATVDEKGVVTAKQEGNCKIYASARSNSAKKDFIVLKVTRFTKYPESIKIAPEEGSVLETGNTVKFTATLMPENTTERNVSWRVFSSNATIDQNGNLIIKDKGKITVKAYSVDRKQSAEYVFDSKYSASHFSTIGTAENVLSDRKIILEFDETINLNSAKYSIKAYKDEYCNGEEVPINIEVNDKTITISPQNSWDTGNTYIAIKESIMDIYDNRLGKNLKYVVNVRG